MPKLLLNDIHFIISQMKKIDSLKSKQSTKLLNNLFILLEKNSISSENKEKLLLAKEKEKLHENFLELCFLRRDLVNQVSKEYYEKPKIKFNTDIDANIDANIVNNTLIVNNNHIDNNRFNNDFTNFCIFYKKLSTVKNLLKDAIEKDSENVNAYEYVNRYFKNKKKY